jgi:mannobiose 2-epimerase
MNLTDLRRAAKSELVENILPFTRDRMVDHADGGFYGSVSNDIQINHKASRGAVQCSRILWTYSRAFRLFGEQQDLQVAEHAYDYLTGTLYDKKYGGYYWSVSAKGKPLNKAKNTYSQAFCVYALSEYFRATANEECLEQARALYNLLEKHTVLQSGGYGDSYQRNWKFNAGRNIDQTDFSAPLTMNTHLHLLEAYTNLYFAAPDKILRERLRNLISIMTQKVFDPAIGYQRLHFDIDWNPVGNQVSYGHDIEASWLLWEAAEAIGDLDTMADAHSVALILASQVYKHGLDEHGAVVWEGTPQGATDGTRYWWPQAEALVGFLNAYRLSSDSIYLDSVFKSWDVIQQNFIDRENGEWFAKIDPRGNRMDAEKAGMWKTPYHNGRACMELLERIQESSDV